MSKAKSRKVARRRHACRVAAVCFFAAMFSGWEAPRAASQERLPPIDAPVIESPARQSRNESIPGAQPAIPPAGTPPINPAAGNGAEVVVPIGPPWWEAEVVQPLNLGRQPRNISIEKLIVATLQHSPQVQVLGDRVLVRQYGADEALAKFDLKTFMETRFTDTSDPVGNKLTTGGASRYFDRNWNYSAGVRKNTVTGAQIEASQRIGYQGNNSIFFSPNPQGTAKLAVTITQPLLNGAGKCYQESTILLAQTDTDVARDRLAQDLQGIIFDVHRNYWDLYVQRAALLQRRRLYQQAQQILSELNARRDLDVLTSQLVRARSAIARREAAMIRIAASVKNAESRLRAIVNDPGLAVGEELELIPASCVTPLHNNVLLSDALTTALQHRPEINQALNQLKSASIRAGVAQNELMPVLNLVLGSYVYGLNGQTDIGKSLGDQFATGRPSYWAGFLFEMPLGNRAASARVRQRQTEIRQLTAEIQSVTTTVRSEVEIAVREISTVQKEYESKLRAITAAHIEIEYLTERWRLLPGDGQDAGSLLDDLLAAQERLADAEQSLVTSHAACALAFIQLQKSTGQLLTDEQMLHLLMDANPPEATSAPAHLMPPPAGYNPASVPTPNHPLPPDMRQSVANLPSQRQTLPSSPFPPQAMRAASPAFAPSQSTIAAPGIPPFSIHRLPRVE